MPPTVVMIHGMWGGSWCWEKYRGYFEQRGYRCIVPTLPYHDTDPQAQPDPRLGTTGLLEYADVLSRQIEQLDQAPVLMGHSMGALLAQMLASRNLAAALVLLTPAAPAGILSLRASVVRSFLPVVSTWGFWRKPVRLTFGKAVYGILNLLPRREQRVTYDRLVHESGRAVFEIGFWFLDSRHATRIDEQKVTCPVFVVGSEHDHVTPPAVVRRVTQKYNHVSTYRELSGHAHWVIGEPGWEEIAALIARWLDEQALADEKRPGDRSGGEPRHPSLHYS